MISSASGLPTISPQNPPHLPTGFPTGELSGIYETTSGKCFRCSIGDVDQVNRLFCGQKCTDRTGQNHIMEARSKKTTVFEASRGIATLNLETESHPSLLFDLGNVQPAACNSCVPAGKLYSGYAEHLELTRLSQGLSVQCAEKLARGRSAPGSGQECGEVVSLSELPEHYQAAHPELSLPGELTEHYGAAHLPMVDQRSPVVPLPSAPFAPEQTGAMAIAPGRQDQLADVNAIKNGIEGMVSGMEAFKGKIGESIQRQDQRIDAYNQQQTNIQSQLGQLTGAMPDYVRRLEELEQTVKQLSIKSDKSDLKINALKEQLRLNANGTFVWKLEDFDKTVNDIAAGSTSNFFFSDSFYTAPKNGYKLRAKIYPCGDGQGLNTHVSLFIQVLKGEDDDHMAWPMKKQVTFEVLDKEHAPYEGRADSFGTNPDSSSFQKPTSEKNIASGCPVFLPMADVHNLLHEDGCLYIRIKVEDRV